MAKIKWTLYINISKNNNKKSKPKHLNRPSHLYINEGVVTPFKSKEYEREYHAHLKYRAIMKLGGQCANPFGLHNKPFTDMRCLCVDHINGGGNKERKRISSYGIYLRVLKGESGYQILCMNCNWIKKDMNGE